ncbi:MAG: hypothetical protein QXE31_06165 [Candidatus Woesearchaeota archaeon]
MFFDFSINLELILKLDEKEYTFNLLGEFNLIRIGTFNNPELRDNEQYLNMNRIFPHIQGLYKNQTYLTLEFSNRILKIYYQGKQVSALKTGETYSQTIETYNLTKPKLIIKYNP